MSTRSLLPLWLRGLVAGSLLAVAVPSACLTSAIADPPLIKKVAAPAGEIAPLALERVDRSARAVTALKMGPGELKAFESEPGISWTLYVSSAATDEKSLQTFKLDAGCVAVGVDVTTKEFGQFKVPAGKTAFVIACSPKVKTAGQFTLIKQQVVVDKEKGTGEIVELGRMTITVGSDDKQDDGKKKEDEGKVDPAPNPNKVEKVYIAIVKNASNTSVDEATIIGDTPFWNDLVKGGSDWDIYDVKNTEAVQKKYVDTLAGAVPGVLIMNKDSGKLLKKFKLPVGAGAKDEIKKLVAEVKK